MVDYKEKYLKYKLKYLNLKKTKLGGMEQRRRSRTPDPRPHVEWLVRAI